MVDIVLAGYSTNCLTFGPSATGKTHTLFGSDHEPGLIQSTTKDLYRRIDDDHNNEYRVSFSYWEMNCDSIKDALNVDNPLPLNVRRDKSGIFVTNLTRLEVSTWEELDEMLMQGNIKRIQMSEQRNARWHGFVKLYIESVDRSSRTMKITRTLTFAQLKGPDRVGQKGARGEVLKHGSNINKSISLLTSAVLHAVEFRRKGIRSVSTEEDHRALIERSESFFMESKFTQLMSQCLCGLEACFVIGTVCALDYHETTDALENLQNMQQLTASLRQQGELTREGRLLKQLSKAEEQLPRHNLASGHPLNEIEERVARIKAKLTGANTDDGSAKKSEIPPPYVPQHVQQWKQSVIKSKLHGDRATVYIPTGSASHTYKGQWSRGKKEGFGEHITETNKYCGEYKEGLREGEGTLWVRKSREGEWTRVYKGSWRQDKRHGRGINYYSSGDVYDGFFENGLRSAIGKLFLANGDRIEGQFRNDMVEGWATLYVKNGDWFEGYWSQGMREGPGVWYYESKQQCLRGEWSKNIPRFGVVEDLPGKETSEKSSFLPRVELLDYESVLQDEKDKLDDRRRREREARGESWDPPAPPHYDFEDQREDGGSNDEPIPSSEGVNW
jgi:hypothetical protein